VEPARAPAEKFVCGVTAAASLLPPSCFAVKHPYTPRCGERSGCIRGFRERHGLHQLRDFLVRALRLPGSDTVFPGIERGERGFRLPNCFNKSER